MSDELEQTFVSLVKASWDKYDQTIYNKHMDDLLVGAVITAIVEGEYSLIDLKSDGVHHYLRFEHLPSKRRLIFELTNLTEDIVSAKVLGRHARVIIGYGQMVKNIGSMWSMLKNDFKSGFLDTTEPGVITFDVDLDTGYLYAQVPLILDLDQYFGDSYQVKQKLLNQHLAAVVQSLAKYLKGRVGA